MHKEHLLPFCMELSKQLGGCLHLEMSIKVNLEVARGGEPVATERAHKECLSSMGTEVDLQGTQSPNPC